MLVPRRYGGYEFDVPTFVRVIAHLARGCPSTAWQVCLPTAHALLVAAWFDERAQDELFVDPDFLCPSVAAPVGAARATGDGFLELTGHPPLLLGRAVRHALPRPDAPGRPGGPPMLFVAPRSEWTMLDDWGHTLGLKGSGSNSIVFDGGRIPEYFALPDTQMLHVDNSGGTPGQRLHGNPMYVGRALSFFGLEFIALAVGMVKGALDEYLELITTRTTHRPPIVLRVARSRLPALVRPRAREGRDRRGGDAAAPPTSGWRPAGARSRRACTSTSRRTCGSSRSRASRCACAGTRCRSTSSARRARARPTTASACSASGATCRWSGATSASVIGDWAARGMATEHLGIEPEGAGPRKV